MDSLFDVRQDIPKGILAGDKRSETERSLRFTMGTNNPTSRLTSGLHNTDLWMNHQFLTLTRPNPPIQSLFFRFLPSHISHNLHCTRNQAIITGTIFHDSFIIPSQNLSHLVSLLVHTKLISVHQEFSITADDIADIVFPEQNKPL